VAKRPTDHDRRPGEEHGYFPGTVLALKEYIPRYSLMEERRPFCEGCLQRCDRGKREIFDFDQSCSVLCEISIRGGDYCDWIPDEPHALSRQWRPCRAVVAISMEFSLDRA